MKLGNILKKWRIIEQITIREAGKQMGISAATLSRIENGETMDGATLAKILSWMVAPQ